MIIFTGMRTHVISYTCSLDFKYFPFKMFIVYSHRLTASESVPYVTNARTSSVCAGVVHTHTDLRVSAHCVCVCVCVCVRVYMCV